MNAATLPLDAALQSADNADSNLLSILVKNVYHPFETQHLKLAPTTTIATLKRCLTDKLPTHPTPKQQKLICSGRICKNEQELQDIAKVIGHFDNQDEEDVPIVFHLMLPSVPKATTSAPAESKTEVKTEEKKEEESPVSNQEEEPEEPVPAPALVPAPAVAPAAAPTPASATSVPSAAGEQPNQYQMYMQLMMLQQQTMILSQIQYLQHLQAQIQAHNASGSAAGQAAATTPATNPAPQYQDPYQMAMNIGAMAYFGQMPPHVAVPGAANLPNMAAQANIAPAPVGVGVEAAAAAVAAPRFGRLQEVWALLDLRMALKMAFMLFILGQDLPTNRLILLSTMVVATYLYFTGILKKLLELVRPRPPQEDAAAAPDGAQRIFNSPAVANASRLLRISEERGFWKDLGSFFGGLLLSLAPAWHPQAMQNQVDNAVPADAAAPEMDMGNLQGI